MEKYMVPGPGDWSIRQLGAGLVPLFSDGVQPLVVITAVFTVVTTNLLAIPGSAKARAVMFTGGPRSGTVFLDGAENITLRHNLFDAVGGNAVFMNGYVRWCNPSLASF
jgi:hypothetical protein